MRDAMNEEAPHFAQIVCCLLMTGGNIAPIALASGMGLGHCLNIALVQALILAGQMVRFLRHCPQVVVHYSSLLELRVALSSTALASSGGTALSTCRNRLPLPP